MTRDSNILPPPSEKEAVNIYLRIKPKTPEESEFYSCTDESGLATAANAAAEDENFEVVTIESTHQVQRGSKIRTCPSIELSKVGWLANGACKYFSKFVLECFFNQIASQKSSFEWLI